MRQVPVDSGMRGEAGAGGGEEMKHFAELLALTFVLCSIIFAYVVAQIVLILVASGVITVFAMGFILGFLTPIVIAVQLLRGSICNYTPSVFNTSMNSWMEMFR
jgi:hypothetical protein